MTKGMEGRKVQETARKEAKEKRKREKEKKRKREKEKKRRWSNRHEENEEIMTAIKMFPITFYHSNISSPPHLLK
jgi:uncharacterized membrane protein